MLKKAGFDLEPGGALAGALWDDLLDALATGTDDTEPGEPAGALAGRRIGRLRVERLLDAGGMGEVYEAYDELLERTVALKTLRPDHDPSEQARARFLREARILSQLDHPNVCRLHDLVEHAGGEALVLELLSGETLRQRLERAPRPTLEEGLAIATEIASGLAAAHAAGVIHRDLKPSNVMLGASGQVKLIDFGIARREPGVAAAAAGASAEPEPRAQLFHTRQGSTLGTLAYMSPEQAAGETLTSASDVYSFGILLVELLAGRSAYRSANAGELLGKVCRADVEPLDDLPEEPRALLKSMLSAEPGSRPTIDEVERRLSELALAPERAALQQRRLRWVAAVAAVLVIATGLAYRANRPEPLLEAGKPARLAVLPFDNASGDPRLDWVENGLTEMVSDNLATVPDLSVVAQREVSELLRQKLLAPPFAPSALAGVLDGLGATVAVLARVEPGTEPGSWRLVYQAARPGIEARERVIEHDDLLAAANELSARLTRRLSPEALLPDLRERFSEVPLANQLHAMGLQRLRQEKGASAGSFFRVARELDGGFLDATLRLAEALALEARWGEATEEATALVERARSLGREDLAGSGYTVLANAAHGRDEREEAARWGEQALASAQRSGNREGLAAAYHALGRSLRFLDPPRGRECFEHALELNRELGSRLGEAKAVHALGVMDDEAGDTDAAETRFREALALAEALDAPRLQAIVLDSQGITLGRRDPAGAATLFERSVALHRQSGDRRALVFSLGNLADALHSTENLDAAEAAFRAAEQVCTEIEAPIPCALNAFNFAELLLQTGRADAALPLIERAEAVYGASDPDLIYERAMYQAAIGQVAAGRRLLEQAMAAVDIERKQSFAGGFEAILALREKGG